MAPLAGVSTSGNSLVSKSSNGRGGQVTYLSKSAFWMVLDRDHKWAVWVGVISAWTRLSELLVNRTKRFPMRYLVFDAEFLCLRLLFSPRLYGILLLVRNLDGRVR
jgi:hypothetical protein